MILKGEISDRGVMLPLQSHIYTPILEELKQNGIAFKEIEMTQ
jgi:hypothetical protein